MAVEAEIFVINYVLYSQFNAAGHRKSVLLVRLRLPFLDHPCGLQTPAVSILVRPGGFIGFTSASASWLLRLCFGPKRRAFRERVVEVVRPLVPLSGQISLLVIGQLQKFSQ
jgi:hypothetical protein